MIWRRQAVLGYCVNHCRNLVIPEAVHLKCLGRADTGADAAAGALDFIMADSAVFIYEGRVERTGPETGQARHAFIPVMFGNDT